MSFVVSFETLPNHVKSKVDIAWQIKADFPPIFIDKVES
jgi:hypothetical protein